MSLSNFHALRSIRAVELEAREAVELPARFVTTRWSVVLAAGADGSRNGSGEALSYLCRTYWRPVFAFIRRHGYSLADAQDVTQEFFIKVIRGNLLQAATPERGRFRNLLLRSLENFLRDSHDRSSAQRRGGGTEFIAWDDWMSAPASQLNLTDDALATCAPDQLFDIRWAAALIEQAQARLAEECEQRGRRRVFEAVRPLLSADRGEVSYALLARELGVDQVIVKRLIFGVRQRYRELLREEVAQTVARAEDVDDELRYLCAVLAASEK